MAKFPLKPLQLSYSYDRNSDKILIGLDKKNSHALQLVIPGNKFLAKK